MSENTTQNTQTDPTPVVSTSVVNLAVESVIALINAMGNFADMTRGALGISSGLSCEVAPSIVQEVYLDKNSFIPITLALNGKHPDLRTLTDTMNNIQDTMSRRTTYPTGNGFEVVDISTGNLPRVIGRGENNLWLVACDLVVKIYRKDDEANESELGEHD